MALHFCQEYLPCLNSILNFHQELAGEWVIKHQLFLPKKVKGFSIKMYYRLNADNNKLERSYGVNADINYKTKFADGDISFSINHLFFYTRITDPLLLQPDGSNYRFNTVQRPFR